MAKTVFRKIGGRIVPIKMSSKITEVGGLKSVDVIVKDESGKKIGSFWAAQSKIKKTRFEVGSYLEKDFRRIGIGSEAYGDLAKSVKKAGGETIFGWTNNIGRIGKIRSSLGKTRSYVPSGEAGGMMYVTRLKKLKKSK